MPSARRGKRHGNLDWAAVYERAGRAVSQTLHAPPKGSRRYDVPEDRWNVETTDSVTGVERRVASSATKTAATILADAFMGRVRKVPVGTLVQTYEAVTRGVRVYDAAWVFRGNRWHKVPAKRE